MAKSKFALKLGPISLLFWPKISTSLWDPLGCSDLSQIFFGSSPVATDWDKTVAEIIHTIFVFLGHPTELGSMNYNRGYSCSVTMCCHNHIVNIICGLLGITNQFNLTGIFPRQITQICSGNLITVIFICAKFSEYCKL